MTYDIPNDEHSMLQILDYNGITLEIRSTELPRQRICVMRSHLRSLIEMLEKVELNSIRDPLQCEKTTYP